MYALVHPSIHVLPVSRTIIDDNHQTLSKQTQKNISKSLLQHNYLLKVGKFSIARGKGEGKNKS